jgi:PPM family protein phosphatase
VASILRSAGSLDEAADELVRAANQSGGKDNITVILFRLGEGEAPEPADDDTIAGEINVADLQEAAAGPAVEQPAARAEEPLTALHDAPADATVVRPPPPRTRETPAPAPRRRRRGRRLLGAAVTLLVIAAVVGGLYALSRQVYFIGTSDAGLVAVYRGLPYELPLGINLYEEEYASGMPARAIPDARRARVLDHEWRSRDDAVDLVRALERGQLDSGGAAN